MADLIDRDALLTEITRCKDYAHKTFSRSAADKKQKNFYEHTAYCEGVFDAWEDAETLISRTPAVNRWIPCSERLPEVYEKVLTYNDEGIIHDNFRLNLRDGSVGWSQGWGITHWQPRPEPPEKE